MAQAKIPIIIGVTGHRDLRQQDVPTLRALVGEKLDELSRQYPHSPLTMLSSLAAGADMLCAQEAVRRGIRLVVPLPMEEAEYRKDFSPAEEVQFDALLVKADDVFVVPHIEPHMDGRDFLYRQAGIYVAVHSHVLLALWDGTPGQKGGCGTAEAVDFMLRGSFDDGNYFRAANDGAVFHIATPRKKNETDFSITCTLIENEEGSLREALSQTERFNCDCGKWGGEDGYPLLPEELMKSKKVQRMQAVYDQADQLSMRFQKRYVRTMGLLSVFCVLLVLCYLFYDEAEYNWMLLCYGGIIALYAAFYRWIVRKSYHEKYLQYRMLAESLRVQTYLSVLGSDDCIGDDFTWTQKHELTWVKEAVCALSIGETEKIAQSAQQAVKESWIDGQSTYHHRSYKRDDQKHHVSGRVTGAMLICTVVSFVVVTVLEYGFNDVMSTVVLTLSIRTWFKILWGCLSAVTVFVSGYYGRLSFERKAFDHEKMALLFDTAAEQYEKNPEERQAMFRALAREEVIESGNWLSYCRENRLGFNL